MNTVGDTARHIITIHTMDIKLPAGLLVDIYLRAGMVLVPALHNLTAGKPDLTCLLLYEPSPLLAACVCASCVGSATVHVICRKAVPWVPRWPFVVRACALHHLRGTCAVLRGTINIAACCFATLFRESGTLVITESFGLRHQEEPCACGEPRVSQDNIWRPTWVVICPGVGFFFVRRERDVVLQ